VSRYGIDGAVAVEIRGIGDGPVEHERERKPHRVAGVRNATGCDESLARGVEVVDREVDDRDGPG
jgi:hypothetical protein